MMGRRDVLVTITSAVLGTAVIAGAGGGVDIVSGTETAASAAGIGSADSPIAVVGAGGTWSTTRNMNRWLHDRPY